MLFLFISQDALRRVKSVQCAREITEISCKLSQNRLFPEIIQRYDTRQEITCPGILLDRKPRARYNTRQETTCQVYYWTGN